MGIEWMNQASAALSGCDDVLFKNVWDKNQLLFDNMPNVGDGVDYFSARMVSAALRSGKQLLVCLPDFRPHRSAFLLATALIRYFLDSYQQGDTVQPQNGPILYFGANIGIREQLCRTSIQGLGIDFAKVFSQQDIQRGATKIDAPSLEEEKNNILNVTTVYSPADPIEILKIASPPWIAIDCSDARSLSWLQPLLNEAVHCRIPVVAWSQNPLSECITDFESLGSTFIWPPNIQSSLDRDFNILMNSYTNINMNPFILGGNSVNQFSMLLYEIRQLLVRVSKNANNSGRLEKDAIIVHWKYFNSLESLMVPFDFYEAEASKFWGLQPIKKLAIVCNHFRNELRYKDISILEHLENIGALLEKAHTLLENNGCALWEASVNFCLEDPVDNQPRVLVFPSESKKKLFLFALLARFNTTEDDFHQMLINVSSLNELRKNINSQYKKRNNDNVSSKLDSLLLSEKLQPIIIGLPGLGATSQLFYTLLYPKVNIILYPHQYPLFIYRKTEWSNRLGANFSHNAGTLAHMSKIELCTRPEYVPTDERIQVMEPIEINIETTKRTQKIRIGSVWQPEDPVAEVERLFKSDHDIDDELISIEQPKTSENISPLERSEEIWCSEAVKIIFDQGWYAYFDPSDLLNIIGNKGLDSRYVRSLRLNERVLIIHGQQRQNLYDLILSRVHRHPSIELHIAMIRRWQEDLRVAYEQWCKQTVSQSEFNKYGSRDIDGLLRRMQGCGSQRNSYQTLINWLDGTVLCPLEQEDLRRIAEILNMGFVKQHYKLIYQAANRLRGLHRGLSNKLNRWLRDQAAGTIQKCEDDVIDAELGLTFGDIRNSLLVLQVNSIETLPGPFLRSSLGRIEKEAYHE